MPPRSRRLLCLAAALAVPGLGGACHTWRPARGGAGPAAAVAAAGGRPLRVTVAGGGRAVLRGARVEGDSVVAARAGRGLRRRGGARWAAPVDSVRRVERRRFSVVRTAALAAGAYAAAVAVAFIALVVSVQLSSEPYS